MYRYGFVLETEVEYRRNLHNNQRGIFICPDDSVGFKF